jgi:hypothetical protein
MTKCLVLWILVLVAAASAQPKPKTYQTGTILSVQRREADGVSYRKATDAPLRNTVFVYDVAVQVDDTVLVGRYQSAIDYLSSAWSEGKSVEVDIGKHRMYLKDPSGQTLELNIVSQRRVRKGK